MEFTKRTTTNEMVNGKNRYTPNHTNYSPINTPEGTSNMIYDTNTDITAVHIGRIRCDEDKTTSRATMAIPK